MNSSPNIAFLGAGNMAEALIAGLVKGKLAEPDSILATDISSTRLEILKNR
ncbi:MAG: NAD(P)-binding domain-containing protein, partial [Nitrospirota bacterium]|nr:NAD(P)-binding domain-containing protein [Nitrospirota bacterium]